MEAAMRVGINGMGRMGRLALRAAMAASTVPATIRDATIASTSCM
jgi:glyceraldehyde-3-phosphate dehydrogenase/erythrose-4-phosphate dehydrogenase